MSVTRTVLSSSLLRAAFVGLAALAAPLPAAADDLSGVWLRENGESKVRFSKCGEHWCGHVSWLKEANSASKIGQRVFFDMKADGTNNWVGKAFNPEDGKTYSGKVQLNGNRMMTSGCAIAGLVCRTVSWTRSN